MNFCYSSPYIVCIIIYITKWAREKAKKTMSTVILKMNAAQETVVLSVLKFLNKVVRRHQVVKKVPEQINRDQGQQRAAIMPNLWSRNLRNISIRRQIQMNY